MLYFPPINMLQGDGQSPIFELVKVCYLCDADIVNHCKPVELDTSTAMPIVLQVIPSGC